jgi:hypothetical protein
MTGPRILFAVVGALVAILGLVVASAGCSTLVAHGTELGPDGFYETSPKRYATTTHALVADEVDLGATPSFWGEGWDLAEVRLTARHAAPGGRVFVGIGPAERVAEYLDGVAHEPIDAEPGSGPARPAPPASRRFWAASAEGSGRQVLDWRLRDGDWTVVVMNADGSRGIRADLTVGERWTGVRALGIGLTAGGLAGVVGGIVLLVANVRRRRPRSADPLPPPAALEPSADPEPVVGLEPAEPAEPAEPPGIRGRGTPAPTPGPAIVAIAAGVLGLFVPLVPSVAAVILGRHARGTIDASDAPIAGRGVATVGMWLGWAGIALCPALIALLVLVLGPGG